MPTVLIVEDEAIVACSIAESLTDAGFLALGPVDTEEAAVALASEHSVDVALIDIRIRADGRTDGCRAGLRLAEELWTGYRTPVVFLTAFPDLITREVASNTGACGVVGKPFAMSVLLAQLNIALERSGPPRPGVVARSR